MKSENILAILDELGKNLIRKNLEASMLQYENEKLKEKIEEVERHIENASNTK
jgi:hypothetical protein